MKNSKITPAYLDWSEKTRPGERWKNVPGYEVYGVSTHGRVRSVDRYVSHKRTGTQFVKGRILKQNPKKHLNRFTGDFVIILQTTLMLENFRYEMSVRRLVYGTFKDSGLLNGDNRMVIAKDGNGLNNNLHNLVAVTNSQRMQVAVTRNRMPMILAQLDHKKFKPTFNLWKPVHRCDSKGRILETFPCIAHASKKGYLEKGITEVAKGRSKFYKGFKWKYASRKHLQRYMNNWDKFKSVYP